MDNPNKWIYNPLDITMLNSALDGLCAKMEIALKDIEGHESREYAKKEIKLLRSAINTIYAMSEQQQHLAVAIEKLKKQIAKLIK